MTTGFAVWLLVVLAIFAANLPWFSERLFIFIQLKNGKRFVVRLLEWAALYIVMGGVALGLETRLNGIRHDQGWEFYVVTLCLFLVFALPGFIYHVDLKHHLKKTV
ncbi:MAG: DUF2818 family protein [Gammaproteobacteria bacterium]|nr:DUF2818 family protein [Gammaproteobacteria bacterium]